jgi:KDO2-lipid IV(A) lauroyltransferase
MFRNLGMNVVEMLRLSVLGMDDLRPRVDFHGQEHLHAALRQDGWGILSLMAHIGNWEFSGAVTALLDEEVSVVVKTMRDPVLQAYLEQTRKRMGGHLLPHHDSFRECLRRLKAGKHVGVVLDQNRSREQGVFVDFFGQPACTSPGLALLSAQSGSPVLPLFDIRDADPTRHHLHLLPAIPPCTGRKIEALTEATQLYTRQIEEMIRKHPEQWIWLHRRWKTQPLAPEDADH